MPHVGRRAHLTAQEAASLEALCSLRRGDMERRYGSRTQGGRERYSGNSWNPYLDEFQRDWGWRPSRQTVYRFDARVQQEPFFYLWNPNYR